VALTLLQAHTVVADPHGDRAWATDMFVPRVGDVVSKARTVDKPADEPRTSTVLADDTSLTIPVAANARYAMDAFLIVDGDEAAGMSLTFTAPSGSSGSWAPMAPQTAGGTDQQLRPTAYGQAANVGVTADGVIIPPRGALVTSNTAGDFTLQWAQTVTSQSPLTLRAGSWLLLTRTA